MAYDENGDFIQTPEDFDPYAGYTDEQRQDVVDAASTYYGSSGDPTSVQTGPNSWVNGNIDINEHAPVNWQDPSTYQWLINTPGGSSNPTGSGGGNGGGNNYPGSNSSNYPGIPNPANFHSPDPLKPWTESFTAPTGEQAAKEPGFQFQLGEGLKALERSAAAKGTLLTGGTAKGEAGWATEFANTNYQNVYDRAYGEYEGRRTNFLTNEANRYNSERGNLNDQWGMNSDYFNMGRAQRLDDFNIWDAGNANSVSNLLRLAQIRRPASPYGNF